MTSLNRPARLNRTMLLLLGIVLLAAGGFAVATHFGALTVLPTGSALIPDSADPPTFAFYIAAAVAIIIVLLVLRWLAAQLTRKPRTHTWNFATDHGHTQFSASTAAEPLIGEITGYEGVKAAHATLGGTHSAPALALVVSVEQDGDLTAVRERIDAEAVPRLCEALDLPELPTSVEFRFHTASGARTR